MEIADVTEYPFAFFPVGLNLDGRRCVVVGSDREATEKEAALREARADVVRIPDSGSVGEDDVKDAFFVIFTPQDAAGAARLRALADRHRFLLCAIDQPQFGFIAMQAIAKAGPVRVAVSTGGIAPAVGKALRAGLQRVMDGKFIRFIDCLNAQRQRNRRAGKTAADRRAAMLGMTDGFAVDVSVRYPGWFEDEIRRSAPEAAKR
ncbi:MAG: hypothetical protein GIW95_10770 [Candidatus Eremiobacteraeota bacterium]|nr:hypothetical protein [Candidatus Eremiobacteraeota bacterium]